MEFKKNLVVFGTRPEALKMIPLIKSLNKNSSYFKTKVCVTAQHRDMLDQVLETFDVVPDYDLDIMSKNQNLSSITSKILIKFENVLNDYKPDLVFVHGDTTTTLAVSISCFYNKVKVAHVEAGLRTFNLKSPWPEEFNRQVTSKITNIHFAPTDNSKNNLIDEKVPQENILVTGNTIIDTLYLALDLINKKNLNIDIESNFNFDFSKKNILITAHRRENFGEGILNICKAIQVLSKKYKDFNFIYPVHLNPNIKNTVEKKISNLHNVFLIEPLNYLEFVYIMSKSFIILTDSGGVQEEAPSLNIPVLVMRDTTERPEAVDFNKVKLVGTDTEKIINEVDNLIKNETYYDSFTQNVNPYGDGRAAEKIVEFIKNRKNVSK